MLYRIAWRSLTTQYTGCGEYCLDKTEAEEHVKHLNEKYKNEIFHWIEEDQIFIRKRKYEELVKNDAKEEE